MSDDRSWDHVAVVIPARDEEARLGACLTGVDRAIRRFRRYQPSVEVTVVVVLDACRDRSAAVCAEFPWVQAVAIDRRLVGAARAAGVAHVLTAVESLTDSLATPALELDRLWIACTDADSVPPPDWLRVQFELARAGAELVLGMVQPQAAEVSAPIWRAWRDRHPARVDHPHIHGANLGIRADIYVAAGGFPPLAEHEDRLLVESARRGGAIVVSTAAAPVLTSGRRIGRTPSGFAGYLAGLE